MTIFCSISNKFIKSVSHAVFGKSLLQSSKFHATSEAEFEECKKLIPAWKGFIIPNIVWLPSLIIRKQENTNFTIVYLSRIHPKKGIEILMEAISKMNKKPLLKIAGTGENNYIHKLKREAKKLGIEDNVQWIGWQNRDEKFTVLMQADIFALTSYNENFANVVVEALHAGTPVLISDKIGISNFVKQHELGWICKPVAADIQLKLQDAIENSAARKKINACAPKIIAQYLSEKKLIPEYIRHYRF